MNMKSLLSIGAFTLGLFVLTSVATSRLSQSDPFDGLWRITVTPDNPSLQIGAAEFQDHLSFQSGVLTSELCSMLLGFEPVAYTITTENGQTRFSAAMTTSTHGTILWSGQQTGSRIVGQVVWTKTDSRVHRYSFVADRWSDATDE
jgi:hypothetical protein